MIPEFAQEMIRRIDVDVDTLRERVTNGGCPSLEDYKNACGQIRGLLTAREHIEATLKTFEDNDDV